MRRIDAWFAHELLDRPPVRFSEHNAEYAGSRALAGRTWPDLKSRWFDAEFQVDYLPSLLAEVTHMTHNVFHLDGKGMLRHLDRILAVPQIQAIQWVQGVGDDAPILQWLPVIRRIQAAGKGVVVDLQLAELEPFLAAMEPRGLYLCIPAAEEIQPDILKRLQRWSRRTMRSSRTRASPTT
jgi:hypothetical protein